MQYEDKSDLSQPTEGEGLPINLPADQRYIKSYTYLLTYLFTYYTVQDKGKKVKLSLCLTKHHAMKTYWGSGGIASCILDLGTRWK
jgi:hypothetical protein